jgi:hypothetical protein
MEVAGFQKELGLKLEKQELLIFIITGKNHSMWQVLCRRHRAALLKSGCVLAISIVTTAYGMEMGESQLGAGGR